MIVGVSGRVAYAGIDLAPEKSSLRIRAVDSHAWCGC